MTFSSNTEIIPSTGVELTAEESAQLLQNHAAEKDFDEIESNLKEYIDDMEVHVKTLGNLADQSQGARTYEVLHNFYKILVDTNQQLVDIKKKKQEILELEQARKAPVGGTINNNLFVGSTAELQRFLADQQNKSTPDNG